MTGYVNPEFHVVGWTEITLEVEMTAMCQQFIFIGKGKITNEDFEMVVLEMNGQPIEEGIGFVSGGVTFYPNSLTFIPINNN